MAPAIFPILSLPALGRTTCDPPAAIFCSEIANSLYFFDVMREATTAPSTVPSTASNPAPTSAQVRTPTRADRIVTSPDPASAGTTPATTPAHTAAAGRHLAKNTDFSIIISPLPHLNFTASDAQPEQMRGQNEQAAGISGGLGCLVEILN
ncbi:hypothetical protein [Pseudodesulfovibrio pelocollis]|uniref:hypothetical protein n=1 Tax=Pseudodesulfovibrio pelocollis TaxID=3051432 RepID=UPI00255A89A8|nr:hypothetical protein [Pseudodesulfovibrio sp. SB368]